MHSSNALLKWQRFQYIASAPFAYWFFLPNETCHQRAPKLQVSRNEVRWFQGP